MPLRRFDSAVRSIAIGLASQNFRLSIVAILPLLLTAALCSAQPAAVEKPTLQLVLPVKCEVGKSCLVQKLVDHDPGPGRQDYRCGLLTTDGHDGVDFRLRTMADMAAGYEVVAAAAGTVLRTRDGEPDVSSRLRTDRRGKDAGNGVVIDHGNGWESQYSHLKSGSVTVIPGQQVVPGERLGLIGLSGNSEFPHLHFSIRKDGKTVDPFTAAPVPTGCSVSRPVQGLWAPQVAKALRYVPTAIIAAGLASQPPPRSVAERGSAPATLDRNAPLLLWVDVIGARDSDLQSFSISDEKGRLLHSQEVKVERGGLSWFAYSGKRAPASGWPSGRYTGQYMLNRNGSVIVTTSASVLIM